MNTQGLNLTENIESYQLSGVLWTGGDQTIILDPTGWALSSRVLVRLR